jgi:hypothetical protein
MGVTVFLLGVSIEEKRREGKRLQRFQNETEGRGNRRRSRRPETGRGVVETDGGTGGG